MTINEILEKVIDLNSALLQHSAELRALGVELVEARQFRAKFHVSDNWQCTDGINKGASCVYVHGEEECLFCGAPEERK